MQARLENWINGLVGDWCVSRQRFFGVPFPLWYKVGDGGTIDHEARLVPDESRLPIDPSTDVPDGYDAAASNGSFTAATNVTGTLGTDLTALLPDLDITTTADLDYYAVTAPAASCSAPGAVGAASNYSCTTLANPNPHDPWVGTITQSTTSTTVLTDTGSAYAFDTLGLSELV